MAHGDPTYEDGLLMVVQPLSHSAVAHTALCTYACNNTAAIDVQAAADLVQDVWNDHWPPQFDVQATCGKPSVLLGDGTTTPGAAIGSLSVQVGTSATNTPPPNIAALFKKVTAVGGRKNRGRMYVPFIIDEAGIDEAGLLNSSALTAFQAIATAFLTDLASRDMPMVIANRTMAVDGVTGKPYVAAYTTGPVVTQFTIERYVATQRRRMPRPV